MTESRHNDHEPPPGDALSPAEEERLLAAAHEGDGLAFKRLVTPRLRAMYATALAILKDPEDAEESLREACIRAFHTSTSLRSPERLEPWLITLIQHQCHQRRSSDRPTERSRTSDPMVISVTDLMWRDDELANFEAAFLTLPESHRVFLALRYFAGLSVRRIAIALGIDGDAAATRLVEARRLLLTRMASVKAPADPPATNPQAERRSGRGAHAP